MGIKGIYGEIGPGERVALSKLAIEKFEQTGKPLRIAIDISIWQFQIQAGQGGSNPAIRTLYYRLLRLLSVSVLPLFVFDGSEKPPFKRNKRTGQHGAMLPNLLTKQLLKLFGFPFHIAPGEAEAECALLQREGIVDAVLSEDVDTLMFGCGLTLRNWSSEGSRGNKSPTHVSVYDAVKTKQGKAGLDREGMVLVALMSGGDYITEGIPGCGIKAACEAARAGYGKSLCQLKRSDTAGLDAWRSNLAHELLTNESKFFRTKHKTLKIPDTFPDREALGYYTHPIVSKSAKIQKLREDIAWDGEVDIPGLRIFVAEAFDWTNKTGAKNFIRGIAPALLVHKLRVRGDRRDSGFGDIVLTAMNEMELVRSICAKRTHISSDGIPELRVIYHPLDIVGLDLEEEHDDSADYGRDGLAPMNDAGEIEAYESDDATARLASPTKRGPSVYDPTQPDKLWLPETIAKVGIPLKVEDYKESLRDPKKFIKARAAAKRAATKGGMPKGALDRFVTISKPGAGASPSMPPARKPLGPSSQQSLPPTYLAPPLEKPSNAQPAMSRSTRSTRSSARSSTESTTARSQATASRTRSQAALKEKPQPNANPWSLSHPSPSQNNYPRQTKSITQPEKSSPRARFMQPQYYSDLDLNSTPLAAIASSPPVPQETPLPAQRKHRHSPSPTEFEHQVESKHIPLLSIPAEEKRDPLKPSLHKKHNSSSVSNSPASPELPDLTCGRTEPPSPTPLIVSLSPELTPVVRTLDFTSTSTSKTTSTTTNERSRILRRRERSSSPALPSRNDILVSPQVIIDRRKEKEKGMGEEKVKTRVMEIITLSSSPLPASIPGQASSNLQQPQSPSRNSQDEENVRAMLPPPPPSTTAPVPAPDLVSQSDPKPTDIKAKAEKKYIMLRDSLPGSWKMADEEEMARAEARAKDKEKRNGKGGGRGKAWRMSQVEVVDLS